MGSNVKKVCIFFALKGEANVFLHHSHVKFIKINNNHFFADHNESSIDVFITGLGKDNVSKFFANNKLTQYDIIFTPTITAVIDMSIPLLTPFIPQFITYNKKTQNVLNKTNLDKIKISGGLLTIDRVFYLDDACKINNLLDDNIKFVDMETFHIASYLQQDILPIVVGVDYGINPVQMAKDNIKKASTILSETLLSLIK